MTIRPTLSVIAATAILLSGLTAPAASASEADLVTIDIPVADRAVPRSAALIGESDGGVYLRSENNDGTSTVKLVTKDGSTDLGTLDRAVLVGDRIVLSPESSPTSITSFADPESEHAITTLPEGSTYVTFTADGVVLTTPAGFALQPWGAAAAEPLSSLPASATSNGILSRDAHGFIAYVRVGSATTVTYVDTATDSAWPLSVNGSSTVALGDETIAWYNRVSSTYSIITVARPVAGEQLGATSTRAVPPLPYLQIDGNYKLLPVGDDVLMSRTRNYGGWLPDSLAPLMLVHPDGTSNSLLDWGHDPVLGADGSLVVIGGADPGHQAIRRINPATLATTVVADLPPVPARVAQLALDGSSLFINDDSVYRGAVGERTLDLANGTVGAVTNFGTGETIAAGNGTVAWMTPGGDTIGVRNAAGQVSETYASNHRPTHAAPGYALSREYHLITLATGATTTLAQPSVILDGVLYQPGASWSTSPGTVVARDLATGQSQFIPAPTDCTRVLSVQAAGSWFLLGCQTLSGGPVSLTVVDRTGGVAPWQLPAATSGVTLGNGFLTVKTGATLAWSPLADRELTLREIAMDVATSTVARDNAPALSWVDEAGVAHVASVPVPASPLPSKPVGTGTIAATPNVTTTSNNKAVTLAWDAPATSDEVTGYLVTRNGTGQVTLPADARSYTYTGLTNGTEYTFTVKAQNAFGTSASQSLRAKALVPYPLYAAVTAANYSVDTELLTVDWSYSPYPGYQPVSSFDIRIGDHAVTGMSSSARTVTFSTPGVVRGDVVTLVAHGTTQSSEWTRAVDSNEDSIAPVTSVTGLAEVTLGSTLRATVVATDTTGVATTDVRIRYSLGAAKAVGAWTYPAAWQGITGSLDLTRTVRPGSTYCLSTRATDTRGNVSAWTTGVCTAVALDEKALKKTGSWKKASSANYFGGTTLQPKSSGASLSTPVRAQTVWIIATTCPTCGAVGLKVGSGTMKVDLRSTVKKYRQAVKVQWTGPITNTVKIVRWGTKPTPVDGIAILGR